MIDNSKQWCFTSSRSFPSPLKKKREKKVGKLRCLEDLPTDNLRFQRRVFFSVSLSRWWNKEDFPTCQEKNTHRKNVIHSDFHSHYILRRLRAVLNVQSDPTAAQKLTTKNQTFEDWWWTDAKFLSVRLKRYIIRLLALRTNCWMGTNFADKLHVRVAVY